MSIKYPDSDLISAEWEDRTWRVESHPDQISYDEKALDYVQLDSPVVQMMATRLGLVIETRLSLLLITGQGPHNFTIRKLR